MDLLERRDGNVKDEFKILERFSLQDRVPFENSTDELILLFIKEFFLNQQLFKSQIDNVCKRIDARSAWEHDDPGRFGAADNVLKPKPSSSGAADLDISMKTLPQKYRRELA